MPSFWQITLRPFSGGVCYASAARICFGGLTILPLAFCFGYRSRVLVRGPDWKRSFVTFHPGGLNSNCPFFLRFLQFYSKAEKGLFCTTLAVNCMMLQRHWVLSVQGRPLLPPLNIIRHKCTCHYAPRLSRLCCAVGLAANISCKLRGFN